MSLADVDQQLNALGMPETEAQPWMGEGGVRDLEEADRLLAALEQGLSDGAARALAEPRAAASRTQPKPAIKKPTPPTSKPSPPPPPPPTSIRPAPRGLSEAALFDDLADDDADSGGLSGLFDDVEAQEQGALDGLFDEDTSDVDLGEVATGALEGIFDSESPPADAAPADLASLFDEDDEGLDALLSEPPPSAGESPLEGIFSEPPDEMEPEEHTALFSAADVAAIRRASDAPPPRASSESPKAPVVPARPRTQPPPPPGAIAQPVFELDDFELFMDDDDDDPGDAGSPEVEDEGGEVGEGEGDDAEGEQKKGFFKKLFG